MDNENYVYICMYSIKHNNVLFALVATSFSRYDHHQTNAIQGWLHKVLKNVKFYGILLTSMSVFDNSLKFLLPCDMILEVIVVETFK